GKVPPRILDQRVGRSVVLQEAVQEALPRLYSEAVTESGVAPVSRPEVDVTKLDDGVELAFTAEFDVRPEFDLPDFASLSVTVDEVIVEEEDITAELDDLRLHYATLAPVERPAVDGDYLTLDLVATVGGEEVPGGNAQGLSYKIGAGDLLDGIDEAVLDKSAGDATTFTTTLIAGQYAGQLSDVAVTVKAVNERQLPDADEAFAETTGFATLEELREDIRTRLMLAGKQEQGNAVRDHVLEALLAAVDLPLPESVLEAELEWRKQNTTQQLQGAGLTLEQFLENSGKSQEDFDEQLLDGATTSIKAQFVLDAITEREQLAITDDEFREVLMRRSQSAGVPPEQYMQEAIESGSIQTLVAEIRRGKALATVMQAASITDSAGNAIDLEQLRGDLASVQPADDTELDDEGRPFHTHDDGTVHYLDED
ncbi:MAG: trigger factor, partial [Actinobacteria bacterium]|nr:trigger factor [Actinomycetota bacterium]